MNFQPRLRGQVGVKYQGFEGMVRLIMKKSSRMSQDWRSRVTYQLMPTVSLAKTRLHIRRRRQHRPVCPGGVIYLRRLLYSYGRMYITGTYPSQNE